jgi:hypothetical protein
MPSDHRIPGLGLGLALLALLGCGKGSFTDYMVHRYRDACDVVDLGMTVTTTPQYALYVDLLSVLPLGAGRVEGDFMGIGRHQIGALRWYQESWGAALYGREILGWGDDTDPDNPETLSEHGVGLVGLVGRSPYRRPGSAPSLVGTLHVYYLGFVLSGHIAELVDFGVGWFGCDLCRDEGRKFGLWPGQPPEPVGDEDEPPPRPASQPAPLPKADAPRGS